MSNKQSGGVVSFIVVAIALAGLLASGLYYSKHQARVARESDTSSPQVNAPAKKPAESDQKKPDEKQDKPVATAPAKPQESQTKPKTENNTQGTTTKPQNNTGSQNQTAPKTTPATGPSSVANTGPSELPETGPGGTVASILALTGLTFVAYRLSQSHRNLRRSALKQ